MVQPQSGGQPESPWATQYRAAGEALLRDAVDYIGDGWPDLKVESVAEDGPRSRVMARQGRDAEMLVVGARPLTMVQQLWAGAAFGVTLSAHAACPVVVAREIAGTAERAPQVVVGHDGSQASLKALEFAFQEAALHGARLRTVEARFSFPGRFVPGGRERIAEESFVKLTRATEPYEKEFPGVAVEHLVFLGDPARVLAREAAGARCLVVGTRGHGGFRGLLLGSVSQALVHQAPCPLIVVPSRGDSSGTG